MKKMISNLVERWNKVDYDPKLEKFLKDLKPVFLNKKNNLTGKLVIFFRI